MRNHRPLARAARTATLATLIALLTASVSFGTALAGKPGTGGGSIGTSTLTISFPDSSDGKAHYGQRVEFAVSTTATDKPYVRLNCYEGGVWVMTDSTGYYPSYPWPGHIFTLRWDAYHTPGAEADCTASLFYFARKGEQVLKSASFHVYP